MGFLNSIFFIFLSLTFLYQSLLHLPIVAARDILTPGDQLLNTLDNSSSTLSSSNGVFTLGFFTIPASTNLTYLGIWYTNYEEVNMKVWVANRDIPIIGDGILTIDDSGTLKVINKSGVTLFNVSTDKVGSGNNSRAMLQDSGNFIVYDEANRTIWQSFDHPTDTLIPGMKIGYNLKTRQNWTLTSSADGDSPSSGAFTMRLEEYENSPQLLIHRRGELYWASGPWNMSTGTFQFLASGFYGNMQFPYDLISDPSGSYLIVQAIGAGASTLKLSPTGKFIDSIDSFLNTPDFCYGYGYEKDYEGCAVSALPYCRALTSVNDGYIWESINFMSGPSKYDDNSSISLGDCMERCWNDCTCIACSTYHVNGTGCIYRTEYKPFRDVEEFHDAYILVSTKTPKKRIWRWILISSMAVLILTALLCYVWVRRCLRKAKEKRRRDNYIHQLRGSDSFNYGDKLEMGIQDAPDVKIFSLNSILTATDNFSDENKLGQGGYGPVYKGKLLDGREIAVKKLSKTSGQGLEEFRSELILISKLQHTNLVRLYGCCIHQEQKMLIYEFMPNKSLDFFLFVEDKKENIDWHIRFSIIEGVAQGLLYLHKYSRMRVIHRDLKVSNVLLDGNMNPKIADFGMARIFKHDVAEAMTNRVVGTYGYMAPEYAMEGIFSIKSDVFSFGVLVLEIVSGRRNSSFYNPDRPLNLVGYAWELWKGQAALEMKDKALGGSFDVKQLLRAIHIGLLCVQENADDRPAMSEVIFMLNNEITDLPRPKQPAFFTGRQVVEVGSSETRSTDNLLGQNIQVSENGLTLTTMEAR